MRDGNSFPTHFKGDPRLDFRRFVNHVGKDFHRNNEIYGERGSPWQIPPDGKKESLGMQLARTEEDTNVMQLMISLTKESSRT